MGDPVRIPIERELDLHAFAARDIPSVGDVDIEASAAADLEIVRLVHPSAEIPVKLGNTAVGFRVVDAVWGFFSIYIVVFGIMLLLRMARGRDQGTACAAVAATLNNLGPGLGDVAAGFMTLGNEAKWVAIGGMLLGRLEIFTLLVLITPTFWRR